MGSPPLHAIGRTQLMGLLPLARDLRHEILHLAIPAGAQPMSEQAIREGVLCALHGREQRRAWAQAADSAARTNQPTSQPPGVTPDMPGVTPTPACPKGFHGTVTLDATRVGCDASRVGDEVITHLAGLVGTQVKP